MSSNSSAASPTREDAERKLEAFKQQIAGKIATKRDIANRQIDGAIKCYFLGHDRVVVSTLIFPAFQIVRDLNENNKSAISSVITDIIAECGIKPGLFWKEINRHAAELKHAKKGNVQIDVHEFCEDIEGAIIASIVEFMQLQPEGGVSVCMREFVDFSTRKSRAASISKASLLESTYRLIRIAFFESRRHIIVKFWLAYAECMLMVSKYLDRKRARYNLNATTTGSGSREDEG